MSFTCNDPLVGSVAGELRLVLAKAPTMTALRGLDLPAIDSLLQNAQATREDLDGALMGAIKRIDDPIHRVAAQDMFPLPYGERAWPKLAARGRQAAERFGVGYDAFRRSGSRQPSKLELVLEQLAFALVADMKAGQATLPEDPLTLVAGAPDPIDPERQPTTLARKQWRLPRRFYGVVILIGLVLAGGSAAWFGTSHGAKNVSNFIGFDPGGCSARVGQLDPALSREPGLLPLVERLVAVYKNSAVKAKLGCPSGPAYRWGSLVVQELKLGGGLANGSIWG